MREVKTVIAAAGNLKREQRDLEEDQICLRALKDVNTPKFLKNDLKLFNGEISLILKQSVYNVFLHNKPQRAKKRIILQKNSTILYFMVSVA